MKNSKRRGSKRSSKRNKWRNKTVKKIKQVGGLFADSHETLYKTLIKKNIEKDPDVVALLKLYPFEEDYKLLDEAIQKLPLYNKKNQQLNLLPSNPLVKPDPTSRSVIDDDNEILKKMLANRTEYENKEMKEKNKTPKIATYYDIQKKKAENVIKEATLKNKAKEEEARVKKEAKTKKNKDAEETDANLGPADASEEFDSGNNFNQDDAIQSAKQIPQEQLLELKTKISEAKQKADAATKIQTLARGVNVRKKEAEKKFKQNAVKDAENNKSTNATKIQALYRGQNIRKKTAETKKNKDAEDAAKQQAIKDAASKQKTIEEAARLKAEAEEAARLKAEAEEAAKQKAISEAEEAAKQKAISEAEEAAKQKAAKQKAAKQKAIADAQEAAKQKAIAAEEAAKQKAISEAEEAARVKAEAEAQEAARVKAAKQKAIAAEEAARVKAEAEEAARVKAEAEAQEAARLKAEEAARLKAEDAARAKAEEAARLKAEDAARAKAEAAKQKVKVHLNPINYTRLNDKFRGNEEKAIFTNRLWARSELQKKDDPNNINVPNKKDMINYLYNNGDMRDNILVTTGINIFHDNIGFQTVYNNVDNKKGHLLYPAGRNKAPPPDPTKWALIYPNVNYMSANNKKLVCDYYRKIYSIDNIFENN